jgi:hypothetical protein
VKHWTRHLLLSAIACCSLSGCALILCAIDTDITREPRFQNIVGTEVHTRRKLYVYQQGTNVAPAMRTHYQFRKSTEGIDHQNFIAVVPAGHSVKFTKAVRKHDIESSYEYLYGEITLNGTVYPVEEYLSGSIYPDGWRLILHDLYVIKE